MARMIGWRALVGLALCAAAVLAGCSGGDDTARPEPVESAERGSGAGGDCAAEGDETPAVALVRCTDGSIGFVETDWASGTGVLTEVAGSRYVLTNLHVVDPFDAADVTVGDTTLEALPLVGADVAADIALLGPVPDDLPTLPIAADVEVAKGDDVFALGFPGEIRAEDAEPTVVSGIVSRLRDAPAWDQTYIQTDARIVEGQSGGPLFDAAGSLVGITGLGFEDDNFGLALVAADVAGAAERVAAGEGDDLVTAPLSADPLDGQEPAGGATSGTLPITDPYDSATLLLPPSEDDRTLTLTVPAAATDVVVTVADAATLDPVAATASSLPALEELARRVAEASGEDPDDIRDQITEGIGDPSDFVGDGESVPGTLVLDVAAGDSLEIGVTAPLAPGPVEVAWTSDLPLWVLSGPIDTVEAAVGERITGTFLTYDAIEDVAVELEAGQELEIRAATPQGDVDVTVIPPGGVVDAVAAFDPTLVGFEVFQDSGAGLYGLDVEEPFTADETGTYRFRVESFDGVPVAWSFEAAG